MVNFCTPSDSLCGGLEAVWDALAEQLLEHQIFLTRVDTAANPKLVRRFGISQLPTVLLFSDRKVTLNRHRKGEARLPSNSTLLKLIL
jgi:thioredoxin-like negative regulator of GroEL